MSKPDSRHISLRSENGQLIWVDIDGVRYRRLEDIPDPNDRAQVAMMLDDANDEADPFDDFSGVELPAAAADHGGVFRLIPLIFGLLGLGLLAGAVFAASLSWKSVTAELTAPGTVVELTLRKTRMSSNAAGESRSSTHEIWQDMYFPVVEFEVPNVGLRRVQTNEGDWPAGYEIGQAVTVVYKPGPPLEARIASLGGDVMEWFVAGILGLLGIVFTGAAAVGLWVTRGDSTQAEATTRKPRRPTR